MMLPPADRKKDDRYPRAARSLVTAAAGRDAEAVLSELQAAGVDLGELQDLLRHTRSPATWKSYASDLTDFMRWSGSEQPFPISPAQLVAYLVDRRDRLSPSSLSRRLSAFRLLSVLFGHPDPTADPLVRATLAGIRRRRVRGEDGRPAWSREQVPALRYEDLVAAVKAIDVSTPAGRRDRALLEVGFWCGFRVGELRALRREQLARSEQGYSIRMTHAKQDQESGNVKYKACPALPREVFGTDPVGALDAWLEDLTHLEGEYVFRRLRRDGEPSENDKPLSAVTIEAIVKRRLQAVGVPGAERMTVHSLRAGYVTLSRTLDVPDIDITAQTHHNNLQTLDIYSRPETVIAHHPVHDLVRRLAKKLEEE